MLNSYIRYRKWFAIGFVILAIVFFIDYSADNFYKIPPLNWNLASILVSIISIAFVVLGIGIVGSIWYLLLQDCGISITWKKAQIIFSISQFGKYLPGNIGQHLGRVVMAREVGIPVAITLNTMIIEMLWGVGIGFALSLLSLAMLGIRETIGFQLNIGLTPIIAGVLLIFFSPWLCIGILNRYFPRLVNRLSGNGSIVPPKLLTTLIVTILFFMCFIIMGLILKLQAQWLFGTVNGNVFQLTCLFAVGWLAGYVVPGAPGGLGVREAMMVVLLSPIVGAGTAVGLGITLRVTTTMGDAVAFIFGLFVKKAILH